MKEYLIKVTTKQSLNAVKKHIEKKFKLREGKYCDKKKNIYPQLMFTNCRNVARVWKI